MAGADKLAKRTGAIVIGNGEALALLRSAGLALEQLLPVSGGERLPLFTAAQRRAAAEQAKTEGRKVLGLPMPDPELAPISVHVWPSVHCFPFPGDVMEPDNLPDVGDSGMVYSGARSHESTLEMTQQMTFGLGRMLGMPVVPPQLSDEMQTWVRWMKADPLNKCSFFDGGHLMYNIIVDSKALLWASQLGGYQGILKSLEPKPDALILAAFGRANLDGRPFEGSLAEFATEVVRWTGEPAQVIWCLHDRQPISRPYAVDTTVATESIHKHTSSKVVDLEHIRAVRLFE